MHNHDQDDDNIADAVVTIDLFFQKTNKLKINYKLQGYTYN